VKVNSLQGVCTLACATFVATANAAMPPQRRSCARENQKYPLGIGKAGAHDHTASGEGR
jgi:hypothetical protein